MYKLLRFLPKRKAVFSKIQQTLFDLVNQVAIEHSLSIYLVGGVVRDALLGRDCTDQDIDFVVEGGALEFGSLLSERIGGRLLKFSKFLTAKIVDPLGLPGIAEIDLASARTEIYPVPGALPVVSLASIQEDLTRRDFSINAIAINLAVITKLLSAGPISAKVIRDQVLDLHAGLQDLDTGCIRVLHLKSFVDDPTRIFRAARYSVRLGGSLDQSTVALVRDAVQNGQLDSISAQRVISELRKIFEESEFLRMFEVLNDWGILSQLKKLTSLSGEQLLNRLSRCAEALKTYNQSERFEAFIALTIDSSDIQMWRARWASLGISNRVLMDIELSFRLLTEPDLERANFSISSERRAALFSPATNVCDCFED